MQRNQVFQENCRTKSGFLLYFSIPALTVLDDFSVFLQVNTFRIMNSTNDLIPKKVYNAPSLRILITTMETSFLQSNLEPIGGGDDPEIDW